MMTRTEEHLVRVLAGQAHLYAGLHCEADYRAVAAALAELDALRTAGNALARAAGFVANRGRSEGWRGKMIDRLDAALAGWATARGGSGAETIPESEGNP